MDTASTTGSSRPSVFAGSPGTSVRRSLVIALLVGGCVGAARLLVPYYNDIQWPLCHARQLLSGGDPYAPVCDFFPLFHFPFYPLMAGLFVLPFAALFKSDTVVTVAILAVSYGLLTWGLTRNRPLGCLVVLLSWPSINAIVLGQWPALLLAVAFMPALLPLTLIKPQLGLPIAVLNLTRWRVAAAALFVGISIVIDPRWPATFVARGAGYGGYIPLLTVPGAAMGLCVLLLWGRRCVTDPDVSLFLLFGCMPQKPSDALIVAAVLRTPREMLFWSACSWLFNLGRWVFPIPFFVGPHGIEFVWVDPACLYVPAGVVLVARHFSRRRATTAYSNRSGSSTSSASVCRGAPRRG